MREKFPHTQSSSQLHLFYKIKLPTTIFESQIELEHYPNSEERCLKEVLASRSLEDVSLPVRPQGPSESLLSKLVVMVSQNERRSTLRAWPSTPGSLLRMAAVLPDRNPLPHGPRMHHGKRDEGTREILKSWVMGCEGRTANRSRRGARCGRSHKEVFKGAIWTVKHICRDLKYSQHISCVFLSIFKIRYPGQVDGFGSPLVTATYHQHK